MKYKVLKKFGNVEVGTVLETNDDGGASYKQNWCMSPAELTLMLHAGFLEEVDGKWKPKYGDSYWIINCDFEVCYSKNDGYDCDIRRIKIGNCFRTESEAEAKLDKVLKVLGE